MDSDHHFVLTPAKPDYPQARCDARSLVRLYDVSRPIHSQLTDKWISYVTSLMTYNALPIIANVPKYDPLNQRATHCRNAHSVLISELIKYTTSIYDEQVGKQGDGQVYGSDSIDTYMPLTTDERIRCTYRMQLESRSYKPISQQNYNYISHIITSIFGKKATYLTVIRFVSMFYRSACWGVIYGLPSNYEAMRVMDALNYDVIDHADFNVREGAKVAFDSMIRQPELYHFGPETNISDTVHITITI